MVLSMTGFGRSEGIFEGKKISVEIKSLNSKALDLGIRLPLRYKEKEFDIRKIINDKVLRGKVECFVNVEVIGNESDIKINKDLIKGYITHLKNIADDAPEFEYLKMAVRMPDAISSKPDELNEVEWQFLNELLSESLGRFQEFRITEGTILQEEILKNLNNIARNLQNVIPFEEERITTVRERYRKGLAEFGTLDETRFYQEIAYFIEKLDISEEKVRLSQHLKYYEEVMNNEENNGKKLGFIAQEIGREINTLGSKANHSEIQKLVVMMKDDLEKIKEQTLNVL